MKLKRPSQKWPIVEIIWDDASSLPGTWKTHEEFDKEPVLPQLMLSVGFLIKETEDHIIIAMDVDNEGGHAARSQIPRGMVKQVKVLKRADSVPVPKSSNTSTSHSVEPTTHS